MLTIWIFAALEILGFAIDAAWHGLVAPGFEAASVSEMAFHLATVHLLLYLGVAGFFASIVAEAIRRGRRGTLSAASWVAPAGAAMQVAGESWHAFTHLRLAPEAAVPGMLSLVGFAVALMALGVEQRRRGAAAPRARRAA
jgi:hypothetical protein